MLRLCEALGCEAGFESFYRPRCQLLDLEYPFAADGVTVASGNVDSNGEQVGRAARDVECTLDQQVSACGHWRR